MGILIRVITYNLDLPPNPVTVTNEGLARKMVRNPGGDWHPGWGVVAMYIV